MPETPDLRALADEDLMQLLRRGDPRAFEAVYERHSGAAFSLAYRMVGRGNVAEDVVQEAFLSIWRSGARYERARGSVRTWVLGIVHHRAIDQLRRSTVHDRRRASDEGLEERLESARAHRRRGRPPRRGRDDPLGDGDAAARAVARDRARLLRRLHAHRDRRHPRDARGYREGPYAPRAREAARPPAAPGGAGRDESSPDHDRWADSLGAWLLGALPEDEADGFRTHLAGCATCRDDAESLRVAVDALPASAPPATPPPALKGRIMAVVEREAALLHAAGPDADRAKAPRRRRRLPRLSGLAMRPALALAARAAAARHRRRRGAAGPPGLRQRLPGRRRSNPAHDLLLRCIDFEVPEARWNKARSDAKQSSGISNNPQTPPGVTDAVLGVLFSVPPPF